MSVDHESVCRDLFGESGILNMTLSVNVGYDHNLKIRLWKAKTIHGIHRISQHAINHQCDEIL